VSHHAVAPDHVLNLAFRALLRTGTPLIAMAHLPPLPGTPLYDESLGVRGLVDAVRRDVDILVEWSRGVRRPNRLRVLRHERSIRGQAVAAPDGSALWRMSASRVRMRRCW